MLTTIITAVANSALGKMAEAFTAYQNKQISLAELESRVKQAQVEAFAEIEKAAYDAIAKTYDSFMKTLAQSRLMQAVWAAVTLSQLLVLLWHQLGIPAVVYFTGERYPSSGTTTEWAYLLLAACVGAAPVLLRSGPGAGSLKDQLKSLVGK